MKKTILLAVLALLALLSGCGGGPGGTYSGNGELWGLEDCLIELTFLDGDMTVSTESETESEIYPGKYSIDGANGTLELRFTEPDAERFGGVYEYRETETAIELDGRIFIKG